MVILVIKTDIRQHVSFIWNQTFWLVVTDRLVQICGVHERDRLDLYGYIW